MRSFLLLGIVAAISLLAGIAVTGLPQTVPDDVVASAISTTTAAITTTTLAAATPASEPPRAVTDATTIETKAPVTTAPANTSAVPTPTTLVPESAIRVVVANASDASGLASRTADDLRALGYSTVSATNAAAVRPDTTVVYAPGFEAAAARLASQLQVSPAQITAQPDGSLTINDTPADLWVLLGLDRS